MKKVLVTGGAGYIGAHTCKQLARSGYEPITYDSLITGHKDFVRWGPLIVGDMHDSAKLIQVLKDTEPVAVLHFAAFKYVGESVQNPLKYYQNNLGGTLSLLQAMQQAKVDRLVFSSTCATYGTPDVQPITEQTSQDPINPCGQSKYFVEKILSDLHAAQQLSFVSLRYFNAAGADPELDIGARDCPQTHLIPLALDAAYGGAPLKIYGRDFPTTDGSAVRDYIHVEDLARAHVLALNYLLENSSVSENINLGTGVGHSVLEVIDALKSIGCHVKMVDSPRRAGDPACLVADASYAKLILGWVPRFLGLTAMLQTALAWHRKERQLNNPQAR